MEADERAQTVVPSIAPHVNNKSILITTPMFYVNGAPHIGHLYSALVGDAIARWHRVCEAPTLFVTGTDEHGDKVHSAARSHGTPVQAFCDANSAQFRDMCDLANISYDRFMRTTQPEHERAVRAMWKRLKENNKIYLGHHEGWYCLSDESFVKESQVEHRGDDQPPISLESGHPVTWLREENYKFTLGASVPRLREWLSLSHGQSESVPLPSVLPQARLNEAMAALEAFEDPQVGSSLDVSVSRRKENTEWGIDVPDNADHTIYVWLDALTSYISATGFPDDGYDQHWPADYHIIGKDILKFHAIYWPAFLLGAGLQPPRHVLAHAHWTVDGRKMSKSLGNVVEPKGMIEEYGVDPVRYFLLRDGSLENDADFSDTLIRTRVNADLVNALGNLCTRSTSQRINAHGVQPTLHPSEYAPLLQDEHAFVEAMRGLPMHVHALYLQGNTSRALEAIMTQVHAANKYFSHHEPWLLAKKACVSTDAQKRLNTVLFLTTEALRVFGILLQPVVPESASKMLTRLDIPQTERFARHLHFRVPDELSHSGYHAPSCLFFPKNWRFCEKL